MSFVNSVSDLARLVAGVGVICGGAWAIARQMLSVYDHIKDVEKLKKESQMWRKADRNIRFETHRVLKQNRRDIVSQGKVLRTVVNQNMKLEEQNKQLREELIKFAIKCNITEPDFRGDSKNL